MKLQTPESLQDTASVATSRTSSHTAMLLSWVFSGLLTLVALVHYYFAQPELPIFYSLATKQDQLANKLFVFLFPLISFTIAATHSVIFRALEEHSQIIKKLFSGVTLGLVLLLCIAYIRIIIITS